MAWYELMLRHHGMWATWTWMGISYGVVWHPSWWLIGPQILSTLWLGYEVWKAR